MNRTEQIETLNRMLADAARLAEGGDALLIGLYTSLGARIEQLLALIDDEGDADDEAA